MHGPRTVKMRYFHAKLGISSPCAIFDHDGPFRRLGTFPGCQVSAHLESTPSMLPMSDQTFGRARGVGVNNCVHTYCGPGRGPGARRSVGSHSNLLLHKLPRHRHLYGCNLDRQGRTHFQALSTHGKQQKENKTEKKCTSRNTPRAHHNITCV